ncbi:MAG: potassium transporter TrkG [Cyclobacteriaceae bacterium]
MPQKLSHRFFLYILAIWFLFILVLYAFTGFIFSDLSFTEAIFLTSSTITFTGMGLQELQEELMWLARLFLVANTWFGMIFWTFWAVWMVLQKTKNGHISVLRLLRNILAILIIAIPATTILIYYLIGSEYNFESVFHRMEFSFFNASNAFGNTGLLLHPPGDTTGWLSHHFVIQVVLLTTLVAGASGYFAVRDLFTPSVLRKRLKHPERDWKPFTKMAVFGGGFLIMISAILFLVSEFSNALHGLKATEKVVASIFFVASARSAGMAVFDMSSLQTTTLLLLTALMFVGGMYASNAGGWRLDQFYLLARSSKNGSRKMIFKGILVVGFFNYILIVLRIFLGDEGKLSHFIFEQISAFGNTGWVMHSFDQLSAHAKWILAASMIFGRVGIIIFVSGIAQRVSCYK